MHTHRVCYDRGNDRLVYFGNPPDEQFWDDQWEKFAKLIRTPDRFVVRTTKRFLPKGSKVIDAGCGLSRTVYGLHHAGYDAYGIDFAPKTVAMVNKLVPELKVSVADVRSLSQFTDGFFDGYWSLGVIEHFYDGYADIVAEMRRVIRPGGIAFVTAPSMSMLRNFKSALGMYPLHTGERENFYQFALQPSDVVANFEAAGFKFISTKGIASLKGLKDEIDLRLIKRIFYSKSPIARVARGMLEMVLRPFGTSHVRLYVFRRL